ncbi:MAG: hypothetical protein ACOYB0_08200 [Polynucleobacter sp.]
MTLQEWLFNGGDQSLPAVRFVDWFGAGCGYCAVYRALFLAGAMAGGWAFGWRGALAVALAGVVGFIALHAYAATLPIDEGYPHEKL